MKKRSLILFGIGIVFTLICTMIIQWQVSLEMTSTTPTYNFETSHNSCPNSEREYSEHGLECMLPAFVYTIHTCKSEHEKDEDLSNDETSCYPFFHALHFSFHSSIPHPGRILINRLHRLLI